MTLMIGGDHSASLCYASQGTAISSSHLGLRDLFLSSQRPFVRSVWCETAGTNLPVAYRGALDRSRNNRKNARREIDGKSRHLVIHTDASEASSAVRKVLLIPNWFHFQHRTISAHPGPRSCFPLTYSLQLRCKMFSPFLYSLFSFCKGDFQGNTSSHKGSPGFTPPLAILFQDGLAKILRQEAAVKISEKKRSFCSGGRRQNIAYESVI